MASLRDIFNNRIKKPITSLVRTASRASGLTDVLSGAGQVFNNDFRSIGNRVQGMVTNNPQKIQLANQQREQARLGANRVFYKGAPKVALTAAGTLFPGARYAAGIGGAIGGGFAGYQGGNISEGVVEGGIRGLQSNAIAGPTNKLLSRFLPKAGSLLTSRLLPSAANVGQGVLIDKALGNQTTPTSLGIDAAIGFIGGRNQFNLPKVKSKPRQLKNLIPQKPTPDRPLGGMIAPARSRLIKATEVQGRRMNGTFDFKVKMPQYVGKELQGKEVQFRIDPQNPQKLIRVGAKLDNAYAGAFAGLQPEYDEDGKFIGVTYNPELGAIGFIGAVGGKKLLDATTLVKGRARSNVQQPVVLANTSRGGTAPDLGLPTGQTIASTIESPRLQPKGLSIEQQPKSPSISQGVDQVLLENRVGQKSLETKLPTLESSTSKNIVPRRTTQASDINVKRLDLSTEQQQRVLDSQVKEVREVLSDKEITKIAQSAGIDTKTNSIDQTAKRIAEQLNVRRQVVELENQRTKLLDEGASTEELEKVTRQIAETSRVSREQGTDVARQLSARRIIANEINTPMQRIFQLLDHHGVNSDVYAKDAAKLDFNNGEAVIDFYRKYVPATKGEKLDLLRYNSMLSSPNTAINNIFSNFQGSGLIAPIEKTITGGLDAIKSALTGKPRSYYVGEGGAYAKGYLESVSTAVQNFKKVMKGEALSANPDYKYIPLTQSGTPGRRLEGILSRPMKFLEATDQFFTALTKGGETASLNYKVSKGGKVRNLDLQTDAAAAKRLFRSPLGDNNGSHTLNAIDYVANQIQKAKENKNPVVSTIAKYSLPFVRTPTNILKQGVEYSPAGLGTLWGSSTKTEQLSKAILGTSIAVGAATLLGTDRLSWAEPTSEKQKQAFKAAGMQAYSIKIGDKWVSYSKLHPAIAFNLALLAAVKNGEDNKELDENQAQTALKVGAKWLNFFADQSYVKSIGDLVGATKGDVESPTRLIGNYVQQAVPFRALLGWVARLVDPYQRQVDPDGGLIEKQLQQLATQIPGLSMQVPAREDQFGNPIESKNRLFNAFSPNRITTENPEAKKEFEFLQEKSRFDKEKRQLREIFEREAQSGSPTVGQVSAADEYIEGKGVPETGERGGLSGLFDKLTGRNKAETVTTPDVPSGTIRSMSKLEKDKLKTYIEFGRSIPADDLTSYYLGDIPSSKSKSAYDTTVRQKALFKALDKVEGDEMLSEEQRQVVRDRIAKETGLEQEDLDYYQVAQQDTDLKYQRVLDDVAGLESKDALFKYLSEGRKVVNGKLVVSDDVISQLYEDGYLEKDERAYLQALRWNQKQGKVFLDRDFKVRGSGGGTGKKKTAALFNALEGVQKAQGQLQTASRLQPISLGKSNFETVLSQSRASSSGKSGKSLESIFSQLEASKKKLRNLKYR